MTQGQPEELQKQSQKISDETVALVARALARLHRQKRNIPREQRTFRVGEIIAAARVLRPERPLHRATLARNPRVRQLIAEANRVLLPPALDYREFGSWKPPHGAAGQSSRPLKQSAHRRAMFMQWALNKLAYYVVGLEELERHSRQRRAQIEVVDLSNEKWPEGQVYPLEPFVPSSTVAVRQVRHCRKTKPELADAAIDLEREVAIHQAHLLRHDVNYWLQTRQRTANGMAEVQGDVALGAGRVAEEKN